jgi:hypothetical protein
MRNRSSADVPMQSAMLLLALSLVAAKAGHGRAMAATAGQAGPALTLRLDSLDGLELVGVRGEVADHRGRRAVHLVDEPRASEGHTVAILTGSDFTGGTIALDVAGNPRPHSPPDARGFVGIAFRVHPHASRFECIYLRLTNGHADDPLRRSHTVQYISYPDFLFSRLRQESPGIYEAPGDVEPDVWTRLKIVVAGSQAGIYLHDAERPALVVHDLKLGESRGQIGLWIGTETDGYFSNLSVLSVKTAGGRPAR